MKNNGGIIRTVLGAVAFLAVAAMIFAYAQSVAKRETAESGTQSQTETDTDTIPVQNDGENTSDGSLVGNGTATSQDGSVAGDTATSKDSSGTGDKLSGEAGRFLKSLVHTGEADSEYGELTSGKFDAKTMLITATDTSDYRLAQGLSLSKKTVKKPVRTPDAVFGTYTTSLEDTEADRIQLELYDGMLMADRAGKLELYDTDGKLICEKLELHLAYRRTSQGKALFTDGEKYYFSENGKFVPTDYDAVNDSRIVDFENTSDFANENSDVSILSDGESGLFALGDAQSKPLTEYKYTKLYAFSEGLAAAVCEDGSMCYIDKSGKEIIAGRDSYENTSGRFVDRVYAEPDTFGEESVGFVYFSGGIVLVREKTVDYVYKENTISDRTSVLKASGEKLWYPPDYTPVYGGDGVAVLEKAGSYGVYSADERWVLQPIYDSVSPFFEGLAVICKNGKYGICDSLGNIIVDTVFDYASTASGGRMIVYSTETGFVILEKHNKK